MIINGTITVKAFSGTLKNKYHTLTLQVNGAHVEVFEGNVSVFKRGDGTVWMDNDHRVLIEGLRILEKICEKLDHPDKEQLPTGHCVMLDEKEFADFTAWWKSRQV